MGGFLERGSRKSSSCSLSERSRDSIVRAIKVAFNTKLLKYQSERSAETFSVFLFLNRLELGFSIFYKNQYALPLALLEMFLSF